MDKEKMKYNYTYYETPYGIRYDLSDRSNKEPNNKGKGKLYPTENNYSGYVDEK